MTCHTVRTGGLEAALLDSLFTFGESEDKCEGDVNVSGIRNLLDRHPHTLFKAKVSREFSSRSRKTIELDGYVLGWMIDHTHHFDSFRDQEMYSKGIERPCTCEHKDCEKDERGRCLEIACHYEGCGAADNCTSERLHSSDLEECSCRGDYQIECSCTWEHVEAMGMTRRQEWEGGHCLWNCGRLDDIDTVVGVWGIIDVVRNAQYAELEESEIHETDNGAYFREFYTIDRKTFIAKTNAVIEAMESHQAAIRAAQARLPGKLTCKGGVWNALPEMPTAVVGRIDGFVTGESNAVRTRNEVVGAKRQRLT